MRLISTKVPRTGSSTFGNILAGAYGQPEANLNAYWMNPCLYSPSSPWYKNKDAFLQAWRASPLYGSFPDHIKYVHCHAPIEMWAGLYPDAFRVCWLRHPAAQVASAYFFARQIGHVPDDMALVEYTRLAYRQNWQTLYTGGDLGQYDFVGISEYFRDDIVVLANRLGWSLGSTPCVNIGTHPEYTNAGRGALLGNSGVVADVLRHNEHDYELYCQAVDRRNRDLARSQRWTISL
jgi:hypothetical protein